MEKVSYKMVLNGEPSMNSSSGGYETIIILLIDFPHASLPFVSGRFLNKCASYFFRETSSPPAPTALFAHPVRALLLALSNFFYVAALHVLHLIIFHCVTHFSLWPISFYGRACAIPCYFDWWLWPYLILSFYSFGGAQRKHDLQLGL